MIILKFSFLELLHTPEDCIFECLRLFLSHLRLYKLQFFKQEPPFIINLADNCFDNNDVSESKIEQFN